MKKHRNSDLYIKVVLSIIAACLLWICTKDVTLIQSTYAATSNSGGNCIDMTAVYHLKNSKIIVLRAFSDGRVEKLDKISRNWISVEDLDGDPNSTIR